MYILSSLVISPMIGSPCHGWIYFRNLNVFRCSIFCCYADLEEVLHFMFCWDIMAKIVRFRYTLIHKNKLKCADDFKKNLD